MEEYILTTIKKALGYEENYTPFDEEIAMHINGALMRLCQLGVGPATGFRIGTDYTEKWSDLIGDVANLEGAKNYVYLKTKLVFDPPTSSSVIEVMKEQVKEYEVCVNYQVD